MARKRVWLFVVEGDTDETAIGLPLEDLITSKTVDFDVFGSDIFGATNYNAGSDSRLHEDDINSRIRQEVLSYLSRPNVDYNWNNLDKVILIIDTDGCFIPESSIHENSQISSIRYHSDRIDVPDAGVARRRIAERARNVHSAVNRGRITYRGRSVPVEVFYLSRNLEHALHGKSGSLTKREKINLARRFRSEYQADHSVFLELIHTTIAAPGDYRASWAFIQEGLHSLERSTNLGLLAHETSV